MRAPTSHTDSLEPVGPAGGGGSMAPAGSPAMPVPQDAARAARSLHLAVLGIALAWLLFWYRDTLMSIIHIWERSDTYAHGYLVAPISLWLVWRHREHIKGVPLAPSLLGVLAGAVAGFGWLLGELTSVASVSQFALVGMIIGLIWAVMGTAVLRAYAFPIFFLVFLVPFGEFLFPTMMDWTTEFVIGGLRASGIPVYAEGRSLVIPSGNWQVVEGCSGVRYLIASVVVGSLYAYLNYRSTTRRVVFTAVSVVLPVLANWVRAWGIVMLGHLSDNRIATGVDHLVYGWVFFGIIMLGLFWIGARWQEDEAPAPVLSAAAKKEAGTMRRSSFVWFAVALLAVLAWKPLLADLDRRGNHGPVQFAAISVPGWQQASNDTLQPWTPRYHGMRGEQRLAFTDANGSTVGLHIVYYRDQEQDAELINSENRILMNKDPAWTFAGYGSKATSFGQQTVEVRSTEIRNPEHRVLVWHWYWIGGRWTSSDYVGKAYLALAQLMGQGDDSAMVAVFTSSVADHREVAEEKLSRFVQAAAPQIGSALQQTRER